MKTRQEIAHELAQTYLIAFRTKYDRDPSPAEIDAAARSVDENIEAWEEQYAAADARIEEEPDEDAEETAKSASFEYEARLAKAAEHEIVMSPAEREVFKAEEQVADIKRVCATPVFRSALAKFAQSVANATRAAMLSNETVTVDGVTVKVARTAKSVDVEKEWAAAYPVRRSKKKIVHTLQYDADGRISGSIAEEIE